MKRNILISLICLLSMQVQALIVNVAGYGQIPESGMEITVDEVTLDMLSNERMMNIEGTLLSNDALTVQINREVIDLHDEFCCAGACTSGNGELTETQEFMPDGVVDWFVHYYPAPGSIVVVTYVFQSGNESRRLTVTYDASCTQDTQEIKTNDAGVKKILKDGILYIQKDNKIHTIL